MATETLLTTVPFDASPADKPLQAWPSVPESFPHDNLGAFRGVAFALAFEGGLALLALGAWKLLHLLR